MTPPATPPATGPCALLQLALGQLGLLMSGQATAAIETPQLGRVEFTRTNVGDLQRLIQTLGAQCAACGGQMPAGYNYLPRRPISIQGWP